MTSIGNSAFYYCAGLASITIHGSVTEIEQNAFYSCYSLTMVNYNGTEADWNDIYIDAGNEYLKNAERHYFWYVTLIDENGKEISKKEYDPNALIDISDVEPSGHTIHLYTDEECQNEFDLQTPISGDLKLQLRYIVNQYNAKFVDEDGTVIREGLVDYGAQIIPPEAPTKPITQQYTYTFAGWDGFYDGITQTNSEMVFTAKYTATINQYTYRFFDIDNTLLKAETVDYGTVITPPEIPGDKDPYTFDYWENYADEMILTDNIEFTAVYKYKTYTITVEGLENPVNVVYNDPFVIDTQTPETEYLFDGYYTEKDGKGTKVTDKDGKSLENYGFLGNITLYPYFPHELLNKIKINDESSTVVGNTDVVKKVYFATDKTAQYLLCNIKYPESISLKKIIPIDFKYVSEESRETIDGMVYLNLICQYTNQIDDLPINKKVEPFELIFDIPKNIAPQNAKIEVTADSMLIGEDDYSFDYIINGELDIAAKPVESIEIIGDETVILEEGGIKYVAQIYPDYATNKEVLWSVDNEEIAEIAQDGTLMPKAIGTVTVTASAKDGSGISATKTITILPYAQIDTLKSDIGKWNVEFAPNIREYTIFVPRNAAAISLTAGFNGGTLKVDNGTTTATMIRNRAKIVKLADDDANVILLRGNQTGCADSEYKITVIRFEGTKTTVSEDGKTFTVKPINIEKGNAVILALYDGDKFIGMQSAEFDGTDITFTADTAYTGAKVMVWSDLASLKPICGVETVK